MINYILLLSDIVIIVDNNLEKLSRVKNLKTAITLLKRIIVKNIKMYYVCSCLSIDFKCYPIN